MEYINEELINKVAGDLNIKSKQVTDVLALLEGGATVPFIARYRKEVTGGLDEEQIREIEKNYQYGVALEKRKKDVLRLIDEKGMLTPEIEEKINQSIKLVEIEDLYRPSKEKKKTKATEAIKLGLEPLAKAIMEFPIKGSKEELCAPFINDNVKTMEDALQGARYIIAENISDDADLRTWTRDNVRTYGKIVTKKKKNAVDEKLVYEMYYDYEEPVRYVKPHRILAFNRAEASDVISVSIETDTEYIIKYMERRYNKKPNSFVSDEVSLAISDSLKRLIYPSIEREIRAELTNIAEDNAIEIFSMNLKNLLLQPPMKGHVVLGVDPAYRTGCKLAVVDETGKVLTKDVIFPHQKNVNEVVDDKRVLDSEKKIKMLIKKYNVGLIAIGNGTASRETEEFIAKILKEIDDKVFYAIVSEAGASVYSASELAREEFPDYHVEERSAVSIARRLQDPLSELVKIDPEAIGVGQYQHDVTESKLSDSLDFVVTEVVNKVGVNVNTASKSLLGYVSGVNKSVAQNIVKYREENGNFKNRNELKKVPKMGAKTYEQAIGFLRIPEGDDVLDSTSIHPESYAVARKLIDILGLKDMKLGSLEIKEALKNVNKEELLLKTGTDKYTLDDILDSFAAPQRDPRDELDKPLLRSGAVHIEDLKPGMELEGVVRNVVDFGAFIDCGLKNDGLVHISKISKQYIKHPKDVLSVGDVVKVWVLSVDLVKQKVALTMIKE